MDLRAVGAPPKTSDALERNLWPAHGVGAPRLLNSEPTRSPGLEETLFYPDPDTHQGSSQKGRSAGGLH